jgi:hypothetical protein
MRRPLPSWPLVAIVTAAFALTASGDEAQDVFKKAQQATLAAPAMRMTADTVDHTKNKTTHMVIEIVNPAQMHSIITVDGKVTNEIISDGQKTFIRQGDGEFRPMPGNVGQMLMNARKSTSLEATAEMATGIKLVGHEDVNGTPASVYEFQTNTMGLTGMSKVWISDKDNLPLKSVRHTEGETKVGAGPGVKVDRDATLTFDYDPSIKITLPGS